MGTRMENLYVDFGFARMYAHEQFSLFIVRVFRDTVDLREWRAIFIAKVAWDFNIIKRRHKATNLHAVRSSRLYLKQYSWFPSLGKEVVNNLNVTF